MIGYYITLVIGFILGYFLACLMMVAKGNTEYELMNTSEYLEKEK